MHGMYEVGRVLLEEMGFSGYESAILHALLKSSPRELPAGRIEELSEVPLPKVYQTLKNLRKLYLSISRERIGRINKYGIDTENFASELLSKSPDRKELVKKIISFYSQERVKEVVLPKFIELRPTGEQSEQETLRLYKSAGREINIISRSMGYLPRVYEGLHIAAKSGVRIKILLPNEDLLEGKTTLEDIEQTRRLVEVLRYTTAPQKDQVEIRYLTRVIEKYGATRMWLHGSIIDPPEENEVSYSIPYKGAAVYTIDLPENEVGLYRREVVFSQDPRYVMSLKLFFELLWHYCTK